MEPGSVPFDLQRMFFGDYPPLYYAEIAFRVVVVYAYTLLLVRWIGGRGVAQLSMVEFLLVIALGSAVGDAMFYDDVPIVVAMAVITMVVLINKGLDKAIARWRTVEAVIDGRPVELVRDGMLACAGLKRRDLGSDEVKAMLRQQGVANLGQVQHAYLEINGTVSVFRLDRAQPGLAIVPPSDLAAPAPLTDPGGAPRGLACCVSCGRVSPAASVLPAGECVNCGGRGWTAPALPSDPDTLATS